MRYKQLEIYCHPRSGSNYLAEVLDLNFFHSGNYHNWYGGHILPDKTLLEKPDTAYIYIYRDFEAVISSVYKLKERFGLNCNNLEGLKASRYKDIFNPNLASEIQVRHHNRQRSEHTLSYHFAHIDKTPGEYHRFHIEAWKAFSDHPNLLFIDYDDLVNNFQGEMSRIANFLGAEVPAQGFLNISEKVGYLPAPLSMAKRLRNALVKTVFTVKKALKGK